MAIELNYPFTAPSNYTFDSDKIEISSGLVKLKLQQDDVDFTEDFADDTDFTYDSDLVEFSGGQVQQKDTRPANSTFYASYTNNVNGNWGNGVLIGSPIGGASVSGGKLDLAHSDVRYVDYDADGNADSQQTGCIRFKLTTNYSGNPGSIQSFVIISKTDGDATNAIKIFQSSTLLFVTINNNVGGTIVSNAETWNPVIDTEYEIELNWDITTGETRLFVDGVQLGSTLTNTGIRSSDIGLLRAGADTGGSNSSNFFINDLIVFDTVQHTSNYTPDWSNIYETIYVESSVILPEMEHAGAGTIKLFNSFLTTETESPRYTLQIGRSGDYLYWTGSAWVVSDGTYSQANDAATFNTNCGSLDVDGENYGQFKIIFPGTNTQNSVDELTANINVDIGYLTTNPTIEMITGFRTDGLEGFTETSTKTGNDEIKYIIKKGSTWYYHNGSSWTVSNETYNQSNTAVEIETNKTSLLDDSTQCYIKAFLHSDDGSTSPELDNIKVEYSFGGEIPDTIDTCIVWGYLKDNQGNPDQSTITVFLNKDRVLYKTNTTIVSERITVTPDDVGYWEVELIETENMEDDSKYVFDFGDGIITRKQIPNESTKNYYDLED
jgi:hypothetical protein